MAGSNILEKNMAGTEPLNEEAVYHTEKPHGLKVEDKIKGRRDYRSLRNRALPVR